MEGNGGSWGTLREIVKCLYFLPQRSWNWLGSLMLATHLWHFLFEFANLNLQNENGMTIAMQHGTYTRSSKSKIFIKFFVLFAQSMLPKISSPSAHFLSLWWSLVDLWLVLVLKVSVYGLPGSLAGSLALVVLVLCSCLWGLCAGLLSCLLDPSGLPDIWWLQCNIHVCDWFSAVVDPLLPVLQAVSWWLGL